MILKLVNELRVDQIFIAMPSVRADQMSGIFKVCESTGLPVTVMPSFADLLQRGPLAETPQGGPWGLQTQRHESGEGRRWN